MSSFTGERHLFLPGRGCFFKQSKSSKVAFKLKGEKVMNPAVLKQNLNSYTGSEQYYRYFDLLLTDGVKFLCDEAGSYWLMDVIYSHIKYKKGCRDEDFIVCTLKICESKGMVTLDNGGIWDEVSQSEVTSKLATQEIPFTDFPLDEIKLYLVKQENKFVVMLPSEY
jgi:hypothetical protein